MNSERLEQKINEANNQCNNWMEPVKQNVILDKTIDFSLKIITYCDLLESNKKYIIARQLLKSGTSIGANIHEAQNAESKNDLYISSK